MKRLITHGLMLIIILNCKFKKKEVKTSTTFRYVDERRDGKTDKQTSINRIRTRGKVCTISILMKSKSTASATNKHAAT